MAKGKRYKRRKHLHNVKGRRFTDEIRNLNLEKVLVIPIDGGKNAHKALVANYFGDILVDTFEFPNSKSGLFMFDSIVKTISQKVEAQRVVPGLEYTGHYCENLMYSLTQLGYDIIPINPYSVSCQRNGQLNWCKTDEIDLCAIGQVIIDNQGTETKLGTGLYYNLQIAERMRRDEVRKQASLKTQIRCIVDRVFPGLQKANIFSDFWGKASLLLLEHYPTPWDITRLGIRNLAEFFQKHNTKLGVTTATRLVNLAQDSLTRNPQDLEMHLLNLQFKLKDLRHARERIRLIEIETAKYLARTPGFLLLSIPYVNVASASEFVGEMGAIANFVKNTKVIKLAGLNPRKFQTGEYEFEHGGVTKQGRASLRYIVSVISQDLLNGNDYFIAFYNRLVNEKGKNERLAKTAVGNKFIRIACVMMRDKKLFNPPTWTGRYLTDNPVAKFEKFLKERQAKDIFDILKPIILGWIPKKSIVAKESTRTKFEGGGFQALPESLVSVGDILPRVMKSTSTRSTNVSSVK